MMNVQFGQFRRMRMNGPQNWLVLLVVILIGMLAAGFMGLLLLAGLVSAAVLAIYNGAARLLQSGTGKTPGTAPGGRNRSGAGSWAVPEPAAEGGMEFDNHASPSTSTSRPAQGGEKVISLTRDTSGRWRSDDKA